MSMPALAYFGAKLSRTASWDTLQEAKADVCMFRQVEVAPILNDVRRRDPKLADVLREHHAQHNIYGDHS